MSLDQEMSVLKALNNQVQIQTNKLAHDESAADNASIKRLTTTDVSNIQDVFSAFEMFLKQVSDSAPDQLMDQVHKVMLDTESIKDEMSRNEGEEIVDQLTTRKT